MVHRCTQESSYTRSFTFNYSRNFGIRSDFFGQRKVLLVHAIMNVSIGAALHIQEEMSTSLLHPSLPVLQSIKSLGV